MSNPPSADSRTILLAEDEETDAIMFRFALKTTGYKFPLIIARDGQEAVDYLAGTGRFNDRSQYPLPSLLILDLKMPKLTGFDVLAWLKSRPDLLNIPAVVLSSSSYPEDIERAQKLGAREYFIKPHSLAELSQLLQTAINRWLLASSK